MSNMISRQYGNSLIGMLMASVLGALILLGGMTMLHTIQRSILRQQSMMQTLQNMLLIQHLLQRQAQNSGLNWCVPLSDDLTINGQATQANQLEALSGMQVFALPQSYSQKLRRSGSGQALKNSPILVFRFLIPLRQMLWPSELKQFTVQGQQKLKVGNQLVIANCQHWQFGRVLSVRGVRWQYVTLAQKITDMRENSWVMIGL